jgi:hypothetical protein
MRRLVVAALLAATLAVESAPARAQPAAPPASEPGAGLVVSVVTFGPGDHPFFKFGHDAIWIRPLSGEGMIFNFGTFAFDTPDLIPKFLRGRLTYWLSVTPATDALWSYQASNRTIEVQELDLTPAQRQRLFERLRDNAQPDKREYLYDYFWDNCSTRVRDAIDAVIGGQLRTAGAAPAHMTLRAQAQRMTADLPWEFVALSFALGRTTDAPVDRWREAFLPVELRDLLRTVKIERDGAQVPLVKSERVLFQASRPPVAARPPDWTGRYALVGVATGLLLAVLGWIGRRRALARAALGLASAAVGLGLGLLGLVLLLVWIATNHKAAHANANILQAAPWAMALLPLGVGTALGRPWAPAGALLVAATVAAASLLGLAAKLLPGLSQDNLGFIALLLPVWLGMTLGLQRVAGAASAR